MRRSKQFLIIITPPETLSTADQNYFNQNYLSEVRTVSLWLQHLDCLSSTVSYFTYVGTRDSSLVLHSNRRRELLGFVLSERVIYSESWLLENIHLDTHIYNQDIASSLTLSIKDIICYTRTKYQYKRDTHRPSNILEKQVGSTNRIIWSYNSISYYVKTAKISINFYFPPVSVQYQMPVMRTLTAQVNNCTWWHRSGQDTHTHTWESEDY